MSPSGRYPRYRAPQGNGEILSLPPRTELATLVADNRKRPELARIDWFGRSLSDIAREARREVIAAAVHFTRQYVDVGDSANAEQPLILTGHQPEIFHPGVWLKNFEAARLARECGGTAINLIIDSDLCRAATIRVPVGDFEQLQAEMLPYDQANRVLPFEERNIADRGLWRSFGTRVLRAIESLVPEPLIGGWWPTVIGAGQRSGKLGQALSEGRHQLERLWGSHSLELPQSEVCGTEAFRLFAMQLFMRAREFRGAHNQALANYRRAHHIKNHAQPIPNLADDEGWIETPFWLWSTSDPSRRGVYVRNDGETVTVSDRHEFSVALRSEPVIAIDQLSQLERAGFKLRTRALGTTLFARLLLADVFIHGIGGAKYDQVTDGICEAFFGVALPPHATLSGTLRLPLANPPTEARSVTEWRRELREYRFHPEKHRDKMVASAAAINQIDEWMARKRQWIDTPKTHENAALRHQAIAEANDRLRQFLDERRVAVEREIASARGAALSEQLRISREYAYCLFPETELRSFFGVCNNSP